MQQKKTGQSEYITNSPQIGFMLLTKNRFCPPLRGGKFTYGLVYTPIDSLNVTQINTCNKITMFWRIIKVPTNYSFSGCIRIKKDFFC